jgi:hypothetical protein
MKKALLASLLLGLAMTPAAPAMADGPIAPRSAPGQCPGLYR